MNYNINKKKLNKSTSFLKYKKKKKLLKRIYLEFTIAQNSGDFIKTGILANRYLSLIEKNKKLDKSKIIRLFV
jgi:hypothetical protein